MPFSLIRPEHDLPAPGICVLCETSRVGREHEEFFVSDVGMIDAPGPFFGRKIVCERCAGELGSAVGMEHGDAVAAAREVAEESRQAVAAFAERVERFADELGAEASAIVLPEPVHERVSRSDERVEALVSEARAEARAEAEAEFAERLEALAAAVPASDPVVGAGAFEVPAEEPAEVPVEEPSEEGPAEPVSEEASEASAE